MVVRNSLASIPQPISPTFTVKEAAHTHLFLNSMVITHDHMVADGERFLEGFDVHIVKRVVKELEKKLRLAGCVLDEEGWSV